MAVRPLCYPAELVREPGLRGRARRPLARGRQVLSPAALERRPQILEEHRFLAELDAEEIPVCPARPFPDGSTLATTAGGIFYTLFDRKGGRAPAELDARGASAARNAGRAAARRRRPARRDADRLLLTSDAYVRRDLDWLERSAIVPRRLAGALLRRRPRDRRRLRPDVAPASRRCACTATSTSAMSSTATASCGCSTSTTA